MRDDPRAGPDPTLASGPPGLPVDPELAGLQQPASAMALFLAFSALGIQGFGGVIALAQRMLCEQRRWMTRAQYLEVLSIAQLLPGPNVCNMALMVGDRHFGTRGAFAALAGIILLPLVVVVALAALAAQHAGQPLVDGALRGMGAVAAGMILGTAVKLAGPLRRSPLGLAGVLTIAVAGFVAIAVLRLPLVWVLLTLVPLAWLIAWWRLGRGDRA